MNDRRCCLVAVDGSEDSNFALTWFSKNVYKRGDEVVLVYVPEGHGLHVSKWENTVYPLNRDTVMAASEEEESKIRSELERFAENFHQLGLEGRVRNVMAVKPEEGILRACEEECAEMLVVGSRGKSTLRRTFVGSVSDYLVHHAPCSVLVCKRPQKGK